jgi:hypothetical protein
MNAARGGFDSTRNQWFTELRALLNNTAKDIRTDLDMASGLDSAQQNLTTVLGSDGLKTLDKVSFIFPSAKTLKSASFYLPKAYWQSILTGGDKWSEMEVDNSNDGKTMSYPGYDTWKSSSSMRSITNMSIEQSSLSSAYVINA